MTSPQPKSYAVSNPDADMTTSAQTLMSQPGRSSASRSVTPTTPNTQSSFSQLGSSIISSLTTPIDSTVSTRNIDVFVDYYANMGLTSAATRDEIREVYNSNIKAYFDAGNVTKYRALQAAYMVLGNKQTKSEYDRRWVWVVPKATVVAKTESTPTAQQLNNEVDQGLNCLDLEDDSTLSLVNRGQNEDPDALEPAILNELDSLSNPPPPDDTEQNDELNTRKSSLPVNTALPAPIHAESPTPSQTNPPLPPNPPTQETPSVNSNPNPVTGTTLPDPFSPDPQNNNTALKRCQFRQGVTPVLLGLLPYASYVPVQIAYRGRHSHPVLSCGRPLYRGSFAWNGMPK
ncbi:hypothetical protein B0J11DRAFT_607483, partial [Dendryphion nanum]